MGYDASSVVGGVDMLGRSTWEGLLLTQLMLAMVLIVSFICYALIEMPGQAWANRKIKLFAGYRQSAEVTIVEPPAPGLLDVKMIAPEPNAP